MKREHQIKMPMQMRKNERNPIPPQENEVQRRKIQKVRMRRKKRGMIIRQAKAIRVNFRMPISFSR
jgi:hypothetical protein